jgi:RNA polymerase sigma-70 factor (ECF subfamily)
MSKSQLEQFLKVHHRDAFLWARHCCNYDENHAKEVLQITYLKILEKKAVYKNKSTFKTWLFSVIRFTGIDYLKRVSNFDDLDVLKMTTEEEPIEVDATDYRKVLAQLPDRQQQVLLLVFYHGMTLTEVATTLELHIGTVRTHYERGKTALRARISKIER